MFCEEHNLKHIYFGEIPFEVTSLEKKLLSKLVLCLKSVNFNEVHKEIVCSEVNFLKKSKNY